MKKEQKLLIELSEFVNPLADELFDKKDFDVFVNSLADTEKIIPYLKYSQGVEMKKFFNAQTEEQKSYIRGRYSYITMLLALVVKKRELQNKK